MLWIVLAAPAAHISMPALRRSNPDVRAVFSYNDVPSYLMEIGEVDRTVYSRTTVRPDGSIQGCTAEYGSGDRALDTYTCQLISKRARFMPARWLDGSPVYGVVRMPIRWLVTSAPPPSEDSQPTTADLEISVNQLPQGARKAINVTLEIGADAGGQPLTCSEYAFEMRKPSPHYPEFVQIACKQVLKSFKAVAPLDAGGKPARSVQSLSVRFLAGH
jgi:protein TonB